MTAITGDVRMPADFSGLEDTVFAHRRVRQSAVAVAGAGALGNEVIKSLCLIGVGKILVVDPDTVEPRNLTSSIFLQSAVGLPKALAIARVAGDMFPFTSIVRNAMEIADVGFQDLMSCAAIFSCVDSDLARVEIAYIGTKLNIPVIDAGLAAAKYSAGRVSVFPGRASACYSCLLAPRRRRDLLSSWDSLVRSCWHDMSGSEAHPFSSTPTMASMIAALQVETGMREFVASESRVDRSYTICMTLDGVPRIEQVWLARSALCPFHAPVAHLIPAQSGESTIGEVLSQAACGDPVLVLDWPICVRARCGACGFEWSPMLRVAALRRRSRCAECGSGAILELEVLRHLTSSSAWRTRTLSELGLPARHLYTVLPGGEK